MKRIISIAAVLVMALSMTAQAQTITRVGPDYDGVANPQGCTIFVHDDQPTELHVNCSKVDDGKARIRYRFTKKSGYPGTFDPADVSVQWEKHSGSSASVRWMVPIPRTVRVIVKGYVHINSVTWTQS